MTESRPAHDPLLDGVRGIAILAVILFHSSWIPVHGFVDKLLHGAALTGWVGVDLFFVLSGFLITGTLLRAKGMPHFFFNFYSRRTLRIFPLYYLFLFLAFFVVPQTVSFGFTYWTFLSNILLGRLGHFQSPVLDITWSLAVEEQFYLLWPFLVWSFKREDLAKAASVLFVLGLFMRLGLYWNGSNPMKNYVLLISRMDSLCAGGWLACQINLLSPRFVKKMFYTCLFISGAFFAWDVGLDSVGMRTLGFSANALLAASLIGCLVKKEITVLNSFFGGKFLRACGKYSFGMYLFHVPVIQWIFSQGGAVWSALEQGFGMGLPAQVLFHAVSVLTTLAVAMVFYHCVEIHFLKLKKYFEISPGLVRPVSS